MRCSISENDEKEKDAVEEEDRVCYEVALISHFKAALKEPGGRDGRPRNYREAEGNAPHTLQAKEERSESQAAEGQQRVPKNAYCRVQLNVDALLREQVD